MEIQKQLTLLKKHNITNYIIENEKITINGSLDLSRLTTADKEFLQGTTINGYLYLSRLTTADKEILKNNVNQLTKGYNKEKQYCFFDGILSKVINVTTKKNYTIFTVNNGFIAKKDEFTAHGKTIKQSIQDVEFKSVQDKLKHQPIYKDSLITVNHYKLLTGACDAGCRDFMMKNNIPFKVVNNLTVEEKPMKAEELLIILQKNNSYGYEKFKSLIV